MRIAGDADMPPSIHQLRRYWFAERALDEAVANQGSWIPVYVMGPVQWLLCRLRLKSWPTWPKYGVIYVPEDRVYFCLPGYRVFRNV